MSVTNKPQIEAYIGASGSGKGVSINRRLAELAPKRLVIWDPRNEYAKHAPATGSVVELVTLLAKAGNGRAIKVRFVPDGRMPLAEAFAVICKAVFAAGNLVFVAEELSNVTKPSWAPPAWQMISSQGRHQGLHVLGAAQRPTMIDKDFLGNCTRVRVFMLGYDSDMVAMAKEVRAPLQDLKDLFTSEEGGTTTINGLEYERRSRTLERVQIKVSARGATEKRTPFVAATPPKAPARRRTAASPT
jgi:hypothetical protein